MNEKTFEHDRRCNIHCPILDVNPPIYPECNCHVSEIQRLNQALEHESRMYKHFREDVSEGFECLPLCNSYGHEDLCPVTNTVEAWRQLRTENERLNAEIERLKQTLQAITDQCNMPGTPQDFARPIAVFIMKRLAEEK